MANPGTRAQLHPLVLLTITDTISRSVVRGHTLPLIGGIVGQVTREGISFEHAFDIKLRPTSDGSGWEIDRDFFSKRLWQIQEVHKEPVSLDFIGFWTLGKADGEVPKELKHALPVLMEANENALGLVFHADVIVEGKADERRMPFTVCEPVYSDEAKAATGMADEPPKLPQRFRPVSWEMATGEAEMIALDFVKNGGGNATRVRTGDARGAAVEAATSASKIKGTKNGDKMDEKAAAKTVAKTSRTATSDLYTAEEEEMLSFLTTRANAIRTLLNRLRSIKGYLDAAQKDPSSASPEILRAIKAMLARLPGIEAAKNAHLASPEADTTTATTTTTDQTATVAPGSSVDSVTTDALLVQLLGSLGQNLQSTRELGGKFAAVDQMRRERGRGRDGLGDRSTFGSGGTMISDAMDLT